MGTNVSIFVYSFSPPTPRSCPCMTEAEGYVCVWGTQAGQEGREGDEGGGKQLRGEGVPQGSSASLSLGAVGCRCSCMSSCSSSVPESSSTLGYTTIHIFWLTRVSNSAGGGHIETRSALSVQPTWPARPGPFPALLPQRLASAEPPAPRGDSLSRRRSPHLPPPSLGSLFAGRSYSSRLHAHRPPILGCPLVSTQPRAAAIGWPLWQA